MKALHIIDDPKFIPPCKTLFDLQTFENIFITSSDDLSECIGEAASFDVVIIHFLTAEKIVIYENHFSDKPLIWFFWGGDGFSLGKFENKFLLKKTSCLKFRLAFKRSFLYGIKTTIRSLFPLLKDWVNPGRKKLKAIREYVDMVVPVIPEDYYLLKEKYSFEAPFFHLNYPHSIFQKGGTEHALKSSDILLGNSASITNNHLEALEKLKRLDTGNRNIIIPLSYGLELYADYIEQVAKKKLGRRAIPVREFLPLQEYMELISSCSIVVMNHLRQEALGNIIMAMWNGAHVYLNPASTLYGFFKNRDFHVSDFENARDFRELGEKARRENLRLLTQTFGPERQREKMKEMLAALDH